MNLKDQIASQLIETPQPDVGYFETPEVYEQEILKGLTWDITKYGHKRLDEHCPHKQGQLTTIVGNSNVGKTTLITYLLTKLLKDNRPGIFYSAENRISQLAKFIIQFAFQSKDHKKYFVWLREKVKFIKHVKQYTYKDLLAQIGTAQDIGFDPKWIFIDPYNSLKKDRKMNGHEYDYEVMEDFRIFCQQTGVDIFLNCHTLTEAQRVKPDKHGETPRPMAADVEGGGKFLNKSDDVWVIHRHLHHTDKEQRYVSLMFIDKVRNTDGGGYPTPYNDPIQFRFKKDWTGFTTDEDEIASRYQDKGGVLIPVHKAIEKAEEKNPTEDLPF